MPNGTPEILVDASYLVALGYPRDRNHEKAKAFAATHETGLLIPDVVLVEAIYNLQRLRWFDSQTCSPRKRRSSCHYPLWILRVPSR